MNPRFQSIMSSSASTVREYVRAPASIILRYRSEMIAQQLCLIEREQLNDIQWFELVNAGWKKKSPETGTSAPELSLNGEQNDEDTAEGDAEGSETGGGQSTTTAPGRRSRSQQSSDSPSVVRLVDRFNLTCNWVTSQILKTTNLETRVKVVEKFIRIAHTCYNYHNFSSLTQIMLGLQAHEVSRLNRTWARVRSQETKMMEDLVEFTSPFHNWRHLRNAMKTMADEWGGAATGQDPVPVVPVAVAVGVSSGSGSGSGSSKRQNKEGGLFSKIALSSKDKDKQKEQQQYLQQQSSSSHAKSSTSTGNTSSHTKSFSGPVFPSLVSTLSSSNKDKDKEKDKDAIKNGSPGLQPIGGCIPFLGVYLSDLLFNTELPSYVEPKVPAIMMMGIYLPPPPSATTEYLSGGESSDTFNQMSPTYDGRSSSYSSASYTGTSSTLVPGFCSGSSTQGGQQQQHQHPLDPAPCTLATAITKDSFPTSDSLPTPSPSLSQSLSVSSTSSSSYTSPPPPPVVASAQEPLSSPCSSSPLSDQSQLQPQIQQQVLPWMINMHKHRTIATTIRRILTFQKMAGRYPFLRDTEVHEALVVAIFETPAEQLSDSERERMSDMCEERTFGLFGDVSTVVSSPVGETGPGQNLASGLTSPVLSR
ncbi:MAG: hypothetical protein J3R72DRAFT_437987 [Linnemannia gamsii]|nr:MAG: hypothetical protein J3R72DRAFT_437987 [Linnemannia gamsii]